MQDIYYKALISQIGFFSNKKNCLYEKEYIRKNNARFDRTAHQQVVLGDWVSFVFNDLFFIYGEEYQKKKNARIKCFQGVVVRGQG